MPVESEYQAAEDAEKYRRRYQKAGDFIEEPEESPETDDGDCPPIPVKSLLNKDN